VPTHVVVGWADQGLHTRGGIEGFRRIASDRKWLEVHDHKKWSWYHEPGSVVRQMAFFYHFLHGRDTGVDRWPRVRLAVRDSYLKATWRNATDWPLPETCYRKLYLDAAAGHMQDHAPKETAEARHDTARGPAPGRSIFDYRFETETQIVGHMKLRLALSTTEGDDMDVFVAVQKLDAAGNIAPFAYYAQFEDGPVALGWLRVLHRGLDRERSTPFQPVLTHAREDKLRAGEIVQAEIEIWPSGTRFHPGETLRLVVQGSDIYDYPKPCVYARHEETVNQGHHVIHTRPGYESHLLIPEIPPDAR
jgi:putative CocE/NonD family hydrolase